MGPSAKSTRRAASVEPPERISSPTPRGAGRGVSLDRGPGVLPPKNTPRITSLNSVLETGRGQARDSVNFSRPMSPHNSPPTSPLNDRRVGSSINPSVPTSPPSTGDRTSGLEDGEAERIQHSMQATADRPVKKKKKVVAKGTAEGSHFASGSSGGRPIGTALDTTPPRKSPSNSSTPSPGDSRLPAGQIDDEGRILPKRKKKRNTPSGNNESQGGSERSRSSYASDSDTQSERSFASDRPRIYNTRAAGLLVKQPSIVREEPEAEDQGMQINPTEKTNGQLAQNGSAVGSGQHSRSNSQPVATPATKQASSLDVPAPKSVARTEKAPSGVGAGRPQSLSPARAAHFSSQPILETAEGTKHSPPARSVSPAKSALKHSPSSRGPSPVGSMPRAGNRRNGRPISEASDTTSVISDEGFKGAPRKKKSARVSFDDDSIVVGRAASPESPSSPVLMSPQNKESSSKWFNRREEAGTSADSVIQPTPALPSFGSVRERRIERGLDEPANTRSNQKQPQQPDRYETSSDLVIGNVLAQHYREKEQRRFNDPLPPEVTSVEGTGYHSNSEDEMFNDIDTRPQQPEENAALPSVDNKFSLAPSPTIHQETQAFMSSGPVPSIAILPATPGVESPRAEQKDWFRIPGQFPLSTDSLAEDLPSATPVVQHHATDPTPADIGIAEPEPGSTGDHHEAGRSTVGSVADVLRTQIHTHSHEESDDTADSIYSDAAEDLSDIEGDGFGSINAIVESPANVQPTAVIKESSNMSNKEAPTTKKPRPSFRGRSESELSEPASDEGWDRAQAYWSGLSQTRKQQLERAAVPGAVDEVESESKPKPKTKTAAKKKAQQSAVSGHPPLPPWPDKQYRDDVARPASPKTSTMKQSMRSSQPETSTDFHLRSSMRNGAVPKAQRNSVQSFEAPQPRAAIPKKTRPLSAVALVDYNKPGIKTTANHGRAASAGIGPLATPVPASPPASPRGKPATKNLRRIRSNDSDSSSSFRKQRPTTSDRNRITMKRSMRAGLTDDQPQTLRGNRTGIYSARSPSPNGSTRRPMSAAGSSMRTSMRGATDSKKQTRTKSPSRFGFGKSSKSKLAGGSKPSFSSRFGDSSDDDIGPINRRSRFEDSSDDDGPSGLTPVRGIPRRIDEGDSTDLEDSSAEPSPIIPATRHRPSSKAKGQGLALAAGSSRQPAITPVPVSPTFEGVTAINNEKKKRSFFGGLGGRKRDDSYVRSPEREEAAPQRPKTTRLNTADSHDPFVSGEVPSPRSPKLQRRNTPKRFASDSWPLPQMPAKADGRPNTSDGNKVNPGNGTRNAAGTGPLIRPELGTRRSTVQNEAAGNGVNGVVITGKTGKKKRFPLLRKAFGLND